MTMRDLVLAGCVAGSLLGFAGVALAQGESGGIVSHVKIVSDRNPEDMSSLESWKAGVIKPGMTDQEKAIAVWQTVVKYRHQENPPSEGVVTHVHEPLKLYNVYGYGQCCCASSDIEGLSRYIGLPARGRIINNHSVPEVWYDGAWHLFDASLMFYVKKPDGSAASVDEMKANIAAFKKEHPELKTDADFKKFAKDGGWKKGPSLFADVPFYDKDGINGAKIHGWHSNMHEYDYNVVAEGRTIVVPPDTHPEVNVYDYGSILGYQVNVSLREGERLTRNWTATEVASGLSRGDGFKKFLANDRKYLGMQEKLGDKAPGRVGNGTLEYDVLADSKLSATALRFENLKAEGGKIGVVDASKPGVLIVRMPSSYVYLSGHMTVSAAAGGSVKASISVNNGLDWTPVGEFDDGGLRSVSFKEAVFNKYDYRMKLEIAGGLEVLRLTHNVQCSQAPLPLLLPGKNTLTFSAAPVAEGTVTVEGNMAGEVRRGGRAGSPLSIADFHPVVEGVDLQRFAVGSTKEHDDKAGVPGTEILSLVEEKPAKGTAVVPIATPGDITRVRMGVHWRARNPEDGYVVQLSFDGGKTWREMGKLEQANPAKSTYLVFSDVPAGSRAVQVKFDGTQKNATEIFDLRIDVDYREPAGGGLRPVKVTYAWEERGKTRRSEHVCAKNGETWTIECGEGAVVKSYTVELAK